MTADLSRWRGMAEAVVDGLWPLIAERVKEVMWRHEALTRDDVCDSIVGSLARHFASEGVPGLVALSDAEIVEVNALSVSVMDKLDTYKRLYTERDELKRENRRLRAELEKR